MDETLFDSYKELDDQISDLKTKQDEIKEKIKAQMIESKTKTAKASYGTFSVYESRSNKFSKEFRSKISKMKNEEIKAGRTEEVITESLRFTPKKSNVEHTEDVIV